MIRLTTEVRSFDGLVGIHTHWLAPDGEVVRSCAVIITMTTNNVMAPIYDRMPMILPRNDYDAWLNPGNSNSKQLKAMFKPCPSEWLNAYSVSKIVNSPRNDSPHCHEPLKRPGARNM